MRATPPLTIGAAELTGTTVAEPHASETVYNAASIYTEGQRVISTTTHRTYESLSGEAHTVTITIATPGVVTWANHGKAAATPVIVTTTGALPTGLTAGTLYYVVNPTNDTFQLAATVGGSAINTTGSQSGVHTATADPNVGRSLDDPAWWEDVGPTLKWAMFDLYSNVATTDAAPLEVEITPGARVDAIGLFGLDADTLTIDVSVSAVSVYSYTVDLTTRVVASYWDYFFAPFRFKPKIALFDLPPYVSGVITVTLDRAGAADVSCSGVVLGQAVYLGETEHGTESDVLNFSDITRDTFGKATMIPRRNVPKNNVTVFADKDNVTRLEQLRDDLNAVPAMWSGLDDADNAYFEPLQQLGVYKRFTIKLGEADAEVTLEIEDI